MRRPRKPQLKAPDLKVPSFLADLYYDLRDRRLLPVIGLVVVAIAAVPFLLGGGSGEFAELPPEPSVIAELKEAGGAETSKLTVVKAEPGLRDYRKRLRGRTPTDPFRRPSKPPDDLSGARLGGGEKPPDPSPSSSTTSTSTTVKKTKNSKTTTTTTTTTGDAPSDESAPGGEIPAETFTFAIDLQIAQTVNPTGPPIAVGEPTVRRGVRPLTPLPGKTVPAITYLGVNPKTKKPLFTVSKDVSAVFGETRCVSGVAACELLEMDPNFPVAFVYGPEQIGYRITVLKVVQIGE